ncbi:hypothetical protein Tco_0034387 [Tanacetum coccineum]
MANNETYTCSPSEVCLSDSDKMPSEAVEQGMDDDVPDEINGAKCEQVPNHVVKKDNLEVLVCKLVKTIVVMN